MPDRVKWEYRRESVAAPDLGARLAVLGDEGWEAVGFWTQAGLRGEPAGRGGNLAVTHVAMQVHVLLKRPVAPDPFAAVVISRLSCSGTECPPSWLRCECGVTLPIPRSEGLLAVGWSAGRVGGDEGETRPAVFCPDCTARREGRGKPEPDPWLYVKGGDIAPSTVPTKVTKTMIDELPDAPREKLYVYCEACGFKAEFKGGPDRRCPRCKGEGLPETDPTPPGDGGESWRDRAIEDPLL